MAHFDLPLEKLREYRPDLPVPDDLEAFWQGTIAQARSRGGEVRSEKVDNRLRLIDTYDVTYPGFDGQPVKAWLHVPAGATGPLPTVAQYIGYSGGRGFPFGNTLYAQAGFAQLIMDSRGQSYSGGGWEVTPDHWEGPGVNQAPGQMTRGILDPQTYYYRRAYTDAVRLLDAAAELPQCDASRMVVLGGSQGGGLAIAAAGLGALAGHSLLGSAPDVPFLCHFPRAITLVNSQPYGEIVRYLAGFRDQVEPVLRTLSYFDGAILGRYATAPTIFSVGLMDQTCPPSTCFAAYNWYGDGKVEDKTVEVYPFNEHEGGADHHRQKVLDWLHQHLA